MAVAKGIAAQRHSAQKKPKRKDFNDSVEETIEHSSKRLELVRIQDQERKHPQISQDRGPSGRSKEVSFLPIEEKSIIGGSKPYDWEHLGGACEDPLSDEEANLPPHEPLFERDGHFRQDAHKEMRPRSPTPATFSSIEERLSPAEAEHQSMEIE